MYMTKTKPVYKTCKIEVGVLKKLKLIKLNTEASSISDIIKKLIK